VRVHTRVHYNYRVNVSKLNVSVKEYGSNDKVWWLFGAKKTRID